MRVAAALVVMCIVVVAAVQLRPAEGLIGDEYAACFHDCHKKCQDEGLGSTFCEMRCDTECVAKETAGMFVTFQIPSVDFSGFYATFFLLFHIKKKLTIAIFF